MSELMLTRLAGPSPEQQIAGDLAKRALYVAPLFLAFGAIWGLNGVWSVAYALVIVVVNFLVAAAILAWAARVSLTFLMGAALFGFLVRMGLVALAVYLVVGATWVELLPLCLTLAITHVALLFWETTKVSASLAFPGLKPKAPVHSTRSKE
jgi:hypothetical protein